MFDSDFNIRLATLKALGYTGETNFDSVYSIDIEILKLTQGGGGGGMDYNAIKAALAASGVTEILFNDGDGSVTLDYAKVMQIGEGGMDYEGMKDALSANTSGVTNIYVHNSDNTTGITMDYDLLSQIGQGGGMDYNEIKSALAASGLTEIVFNNSGNTSSVTLDYEKVTNIGMKTVVMTQAEYDDLAVKDNNTIYYTTSN